jgi:hypothetical protein
MSERFEGAVEGATMPVGRLIREFRKSMASGQPDLFKEIFGEDPAPVVKRYLEQFAHTTLLKLLKDFGSDGRRVYANTEFSAIDHETVLFSNGVLGHGDLLQEQVDDCSKLLGLPVVGLTSAEDSPLLDIASTIFGRLAFTHLMTWIFKEEALRELGLGRKVLLLGFGHGGFIAQLALDLIEEQYQGEGLANRVELVTFGSAATNAPQPGGKTRREHFANEHDAVARQGCLAFKGNEDFGRFFVGSGRYGHMLREHYLEPILADAAWFSDLGESAFSRRVVGRSPF